MNPYLFPALEKGPDILRRLVQLVPPSRYDERLDEDRFTFREVLAHMADWESIDLERLRAGVERGRAKIEGIDEWILAREQNYASKNIEDCLNEYERGRHETVRFLKSLTPEDWQKGIEHSERGFMSTYDQANLIVGHDVYHFDQLTEYLMPKTTATW